MKYRIHRHVVLNRPPEGPLSTYITAFIDAMEGRGYSALTLQHYARIIAAFSHWMKLRKKRISAIDNGLPAQFLRWRAKSAGLWSSSNAALKNFVDFLRDNGVANQAGAVVRARTTAELYADEYERYLRDVRGLVDVTVRNRMYFAREFLNYCLSDRYADLAHLTAARVIDFVQRRAINLKVGRSKALTGTLRSLLRYAVFRGDICPGMIDAVPTVASWELSNLPRAIRGDQTDRLLRSIDRGTPAGLRNYAILLLLARFGMRAGEVSRLELSDIDWREGILTIRPTKGDQDRHLPLSQEVGDALSAYLRGGRPHSQCRRVFLRLHAPIVGFSGPSPIGYIVLASLRRAGMTAPTTGAHQFRHGLATELLGHGATLGEIGYLLSHRSPDTTRIYAKVDLNTLRQLTMRWPGGVR
ncbi:Putative integrase/recombinase y4rA (plasmid) [Cupriavidus necator]|uniref:tyrosine-type recombinase/integrase n=1 Tax=Cupriavidus necator TaxID=106590 RepID=UPI003F73750D